MCPTPPLVWLSRNVAFWLPIWMFPLDILRMALPETWTMGTEVGPANAQKLDTFKLPPVIFTACTAADGFSVKYTLEICIVPALMLTPLFVSNPEFEIRANGAIPPEPAKNCIPVPESVRAFAISQSSHRPI